MKLKEYLKTLLEEFEIGNSMTLNICLDENLNVSDNGNQMIQLEVTKR